MDLHERRAPAASAQPIRSAATALAGSCINIPIVLKHRNELAYQKVERTCAAARLPWHGTIGRWMVCSKVVVDRPRRHATAAQKHRSKSRSVGGGSGILLARDRMLSHQLLHASCYRGTGRMAGGWCTVSLGSRWCNALGDALLHTLAVTQCLQRWLCVCGIVYCLSASVGR